MTLAFIINFVIVFALNFWSYKRGWQAGQQNMIRKMADNPDAMMDAFKQIKELELLELSTEVEIEHYNNCVYVYNKETKLFLGQGSDLDDAMKTVCERFPDQAFRCDDESLA